MNFTILLPHYKTGKMTAYAVKQFLAKRGRHTVNIIVIDNGGGEGTDMIPEDDEVSIRHYPQGLLQSHGIAFDYALDNCFSQISEHFITVESDSFPVCEGWLDFYEEAIQQGCDMAGSQMKLSGGTYFHPAGAMYRKSNWLEAKSFLGSLNRFYCESREKFYYLFSNGEPTGFEAAIEKHRPLAKCVFHTGIGFNDEDIQTYGNRSVYTETQYVLPPAEPKTTYRRVGFEPGQWFCYWHWATGKRVREIPTETVWLPNRVNQQQEYSLTENGFKHLWGISAYRDCEALELRDIIDFKRQQVEALQ